PRGGVNRTRASRFRRIAREQIVPHVDGRDMTDVSAISERVHVLQLFFFKQKTAYEIGLGIPAEPLFRSTLFPAPVEFIAAVIAYYVHPVNIQTACLIMEGAEFTENIINGVERPVKAAELFAFTLRVRA